MAGSHDAAEGIRRGYAAFNRRDIDGALQFMIADVEWANTCTRFEAAHRPHDIATTVGDAGARG